jgi:RecA-family ATPase
MHQLANCVVNGKDFLGIPTRKMPVVAVLCEDDRPVIRRRQLSINAWLGTDEIGGEAPRDLFIWPRVGEDNIIVTFPNQGKDEAGGFYAELVERVKYVKKETGADEILLILDTATDLFGGNENIRREVNTFIKTYVGSFCDQHNATVVLLSHPSLAGLSSGSGLSGSTAWENSVRSRAYFSRDEGGDDDIRTLSRKKSNYSSSGKDTDLTLLWDAGVYQLPTTPDQVDRIEKTSLKNDILTEIEAAYIAQNPYTKRGNRSHRSEIFAANFGRKRGEITTLVNNLEAEGCLSYDRCWKVEKTV